MALFVAVVVGGGGDVAVFTCCLPFRTRFITLYFHLNRDAHTGELEKKMNFFRFLFGVYIFFSHIIFPPCGRSGCGERDQEGEAEKRVQITT